MNLAERRIVNIFKTFIEKVFVPQLSKMDVNSQQQWTKFSNLISGQQLNVGQAQIYVESLPVLIQPVNRPNINLPDKPNFFTRQKKEIVQETNVGGFNPSKSFGGERVRMMFPMKDFDEPSADRQNYNFSKDFSKDKQEGTGFTTQMVLPTLQKLFKVFSDNQTKLEKVGSFQIPTAYEPKSYYN